MQFICGQAPHPHLKKQNKNTRMHMDNTLATCEIFPLPYQNWICALPLSTEALGRCTRGRYSAQLQRRWTMQESDFFFIHALLGEGKQEPSPSRRTLIIFGRTLTAPSLLACGFYKLTMHSGIDSKRLKQDSHMRERDGFSPHLSHQVSVIKRCI